MPTFSTMLTFRTFEDALTAADFVSLLKDNNIPAIVEEEGPIFDVSFSNNPLLKKYAVKIAAQNFNAAKSQLVAYYTARLHLVPHSYYLFSFTTSELQNILTHADEWGDLDYALAKKLLDERGAGYTDTDLEMLKDKRMTTLAEQDYYKSGNTVTIGYIMALTIGFVGAMIGWHLALSKITLPDGNQVWRYDSNGRKNGKVILVLGIISTLTILVIRMISPVKGYNPLSWTF